MKHCDVCCFYTSISGCTYGEAESSAQANLAIVKRTLRPNQLLETVADKTQLAYIEKGWAFSFRLSNAGDRTIGGIYSEGELVGTANLFGIDYDYSVRALTNMSVCLIETDEVIALMRRSDAYFSYLQTEIRRLLWLLASRTFELSNCNAEERLCRSIIVACLKVFGVLKETSMKFPLTQEMLADQIGTSKVHVNRIFVSLKKAGVCVLRRGTLRILNSDALLERAALTEREFAAMIRVLCDKETGEPFFVE